MIYSQEDFYRLLVKKHGDATHFNISHCHQIKNDAIFPEDGC